MTIKRGKKKVGKRILVYGPGGVGKSTLAAQFPSPVFFDPTGGTSAMDVARYEPSDTWMDLMTFIEGDEVTEFQTVVIDELSEVERLCWDYVCERHGKKNIDQFEWGKGYKAALSEFRILAARLERLKKNGVDVVLLGHSEHETFKNPEGDDYDRFNLRMHRYVAGFLYQWCDAYLFARTKVYTGSTKGGKVIALGDGERQLHCIERPAYFAKNRFGLPGTVPLDYSILAEALDPPEDKKLKAEIKKLSSKLDDEEKEKVLNAMERAKNSTHLIKVINYARKQIENA